MKLVTCISKRESIPTQIKEGDSYYMDETSIYTDSDGDEYATIYKDKWKTNCIGNMLTKHFCESMFCK